MSSPCSGKPPHVEGQNTDYPGDGHENELDPWRYRGVACDLVRARRCRSHNPRLRLAQRLDAMTSSGRVPNPFALRPTWKGNLLMLVVALVVLFAVAS